MPQIDTVKIKDGDGVAVINAADFDPDTMQKADAPAEKKPKRRGRPKKAE